jgi:ABC-2 type transport system permease protein
VVVLFDRFGSLVEWELGEVAFMYGIVNIAFAISDAATRGFDVFGTMVKSGDFDRLLVRPRSTVLQLAG